MYSSHLFPFFHLNNANLMVNMYTSICIYAQDKYIGRTLVLSPRLLINSFWSVLQIIYCQLLQSSEMRKLDPINSSTCIFLLPSAQRVWRLSDCSYTNELYSACLVCAQFFSKELYISFVFHTSSGSKLWNRQWEAKWKHSCRNRPVPYAFQIESKDAGCQNKTNN